MIELDKDVELTVRGILSSHLPDVVVRAYGSRVSGRARKFSDLDLVVMDDMSDFSQQLEQIRDQLSESDIPIMVDIHLWSEVPEHFRREIMRTGVPFL